MTSWVPLDESGRILRHSDQLITLPGLTYADFPLPYGGFRLLLTSRVVADIHGVFQMGTPRVPESKPNPSGSGEIIDIPRMGSVMWLMLIGFLVPPALVTYLGIHVVYIPHHILWIILLGCPFPLILLSLPRKYTLDRDRLLISGFFYRIRVPIADIVKVEPITSFRALLHPGSMFCTDPQNALKLTRKKGRALIVSPREQEAFLRILAFEKGDAS
jgi:hypothetical protein